MYIAEVKYLLQDHRVVMLLFKFRFLLSSKPDFFTIMLYCIIISILCTKQKNKSNCVSLPFPSPHLSPSPSSSLSFWGRLQEDLEKKGRKSYLKSKLWSHYMSNMSILKQLLQSMGDKRIFNKRYNTLYRIWLLQSVVLKEIYIAYL